MAGYAGTRGLQEALVEEAPHQSRGDPGTYYRPPPLPFSAARQNRAVSDRTAIPCNGPRQVLPKGQRVFGLAPECDDSLASMLSELDALGRPRAVPSGQRAAVPSEEEPAAHRHLSTLSARCVAMLGDSAQLPAVLDAMCGEAEHSV